MNEKDEEVAQTAYSHQGIGGSNTGHAFLAFLETKYSYSLRAQGKQRKVTCIPESSPCFQWYAKLANPLLVIVVAISQTSYSERRPVYSSGTLKEVGDDLLYDSCGARCNQRSA